MTQSTQKMVENVGDGAAVAAGFLAVTEAIAGVFGALAAVLGCAWLVLRWVDAYRVLRLGRKPWLDLWRR